jgi:fatty-acid desaturase
VKNSSVSLPGDFLSFGRVGSALIAAFGRSKQYPLSDEPSDEMAASIVTQIALVVAGAAILVGLYLGGVSKSLRGGIIEIAIIVVAALVIVSLGHFKP